MTNQQVYRAQILHFISEPKDNVDFGACAHINDGFLLVRDGKVAALGAFADLSKTIPENVEVVDYRNFLIVPGFIDAHIHFPQIEVIASYGEQLLTWLNEYVFPTERKYADQEYAFKMADVFLKELFKNGTTTALTYTTVHKSSAEALFERAQESRMRLIAGKITMDRNAPNYLLDTAKTAYDDSKALIEKWHNKDRLSYVITVRFAPTSTEGQMEVMGALHKEYNDVYLQTHLAENLDELAWVKQLYPSSKDYTDVYDVYGLLGERSIFAHSIHLSDREHKRLAESDSVLAWCPSANFFLGSGLFNLGKARDFNNKVALGSDVGAGTSFSMLNILSEAYKMAALQNIKFSPLRSFYKITLGNARALGLDSKIGNFELGKEADFVVLDPNATDILSLKNSRANNLSELLFNLIMLGNNRAVKATYVYGGKVFAAA
ncbi:MAG: guanine deaminase [Gammaproteobacteria bacterium]|nr:guanine deaminase [Gammaproteobacteria bacterium]